MDEVRGGGGIEGFGLRDLTEPNRGYHYALPVPAPSIFSFIHPFPSRQQHQETVSTTSPTPTLPMISNPPELYPSSQLLLSISSHNKPAPLHQPRLVTIIYLPYRHIFSLPGHELFNFPPTQQSRIESSRVINHTPSLRNPLSLLPTTLAYTADAGRIVSQSTHAQKRRAVTPQDNSNPILSYPLVGARKVTPNLRSRLD